MFRIVLLQKVEEFLSPSVVNSEIEKTSKCKCEYMTTDQESIIQERQHYVPLQSDCRQPARKLLTMTRSLRSRFTSSILNLGDLTETKNPPLKILINKVAFSNGHILDLEEDAEEEICKKNTS